MLMRAIRGTLAVIAGYFAIAVWVFVTMTVSWLVLGRSFAFNEGTTDTSLGWCAMHLVLAFPGAMLGGWVASLIARSPTNRPVKILAGLMLVFGILEGVWRLRNPPVPDPGPTAAELSFMEAAEVAVQPAWFSFTLPFVATAGVLFGGSLRRRAIS